TAAQMQNLFNTSGELFRRRVKVAFDGVQVQPSISYSVTPPADATSAFLATIRLSGEIPPGARNFTWNFGWTFASYAMTIRTAVSQNPTTQWLEGGQTSAPFMLDSAAPTVDRLRTAIRYLELGFTHIVPYGLDHMLFVLGIYLLSRRPRS